MSGRKVSSTDDDYWESSRAVRKTKNLFDDDNDFSAIRKITSYDDSDDDDLINFDGSSAEPTKVEFKSARHRPDRVAVRAASGLSRTASTEYSGQQPQASKVSSSQFPYPSGPSIDEVVKPAPVQKKQPTLSEISKLEAKINCLERNLEAARKDKFPKLAARDLVKSIVLGQPYSLEMYKSKADKLSVLDEAIKFHDGNAITAAVLHLQATIKDAIFLYELKKRPAAMEHYLCYLRERSEYTKYTDTLAMLGRGEDEAMSHYKQASQINNADMKVSRLKTCLSAHFRPSALLTHQTQLLQQQIDLLERQMPVDKDDAVKERQGEQKFKERPRKVTIIDQPLLTTLYYCCLYHYHAAENLLQSPEAIRKKHALNEKQFMWTALRARSLCKQWKDVEALFETKGWLGGTKMKSPVGFDRILTQLHKQNAPRQVLNKFCNLIPGSDQRIELGTKFGCHESVMEAFVHQKDRTAVLKYKEILKPQSQEWFFADNILRNSSIKWKN